MNPPAIDKTPVLKKSSDLLSNKSIKKNDAEIVEEDSLDTSLLLNETTKNEEVKNEQIKEKKEVGPNESIESADLLSEENNERNVVQENVFIPEKSVAANDIENEVSEDVDVELKQSEETLQCADSTEDTLTSPEPAEEDAWADSELTFDEDDSNETKLSDSIEQEFTKVCENVTDGVVSTDVVLAEVSSSATLIDSTLSGSDMTQSAESSRQSTEYDTVVGDTLTDSQSSIKQNTETEQSDMSIQHCNNTEIPHSDVQHCSKDTVLSDGDVVQTTIDSICEQTNEDTMHKSASSDDVADINNRTLTSEDIKKIPDLETLTQASTDKSCDTIKSSASEKQYPTVVFSSNSFVRSLLAEAMIESQRDNDSNSSDGTEKTASDLVHISSDMNSGQTSGDDIDTTASSDIEVLSLPASSNNGYSDRGHDMSPLKTLKGLRRGSPSGHYRSDSGSSFMSGWSKSDNVIKVQGESNFIKVVSI